MREFVPSPRLQRKYVLWVWTSAVFCLPIALPALAPGLGWTYLVIFAAIMLAWMLPAFALLGPYCRSIRYTLTDSEIVVQKGILTKTEKTVPYSKVTNLELKRGIWDRALGLGTLKVHTAGYSQQTSAEAELAGLDDWDSIRQQVMARVREKRAEGEELPRGAEGAAPADAAPLLQELLAELRAIRVTVEAMRASR